MTAETPSIEAREEQPKIPLWRRIMDYLIADTCQHLDENLCCTRRNKRPCTMYAHFNDCPVYRESWQIRKAADENLAKLQESYQNQERQ